MSNASDEFQLYDLAIVVERIDGHCTCNMHVGDRVYLRGGKLSLPDGADFCLYALQAAIPLLPAKQRPTHPADWMTSDSRVICPDPACRLVMRIDRLASRAFFAQANLLAGNLLSSLPSFQERIQEFHDRSGHA